MAAAIAVSPGVIAAAPKQDVDVYELVTLPAEQAMAYAMLLFDGASFEKQLSFIRDMRTYGDATFDKMADIFERRHNRQWQYVVVDIPGVSFPRGS
jgi:hypothetical protein